VIASRALATPVALFAIALLVVNDHVLKAAYPGLVTGKLSDVAGMMVFPLLLAAASEQLGFRRGMTTVVAAAIATGAVFASIKLSPAAGELYRVGLAVLQWPFRAALAAIAGDPVPAVGHARLVADRTDLIALLALTVPIALARTPASPCDVTPLLFRGRGRRVRAGCAQRRPTRNTARRTARTPRRAARPSARDSRCGPRGTGHGSASSRLCNACTA